MRIVSPSGMSTNDSGYVPGSARADDLLTLRELLSAANLPVEGVDGLIPDFIVVRPGNDAGAAPVAAGAVEPCGEAGLLRSVVVHPDARGRGLGRMVTDALIEQAISRRVTALYLLTETAESFFSRIGFEPIERESAPQSIRMSDEFRTLCPDSAVLMRLELSDLTLPTS